MIALQVARNLQRIVCPAPRPASSPASALPPFLPSTHQRALGALGIPVGDCRGDVEEHAKAHFGNLLCCVPEVGTPAGQHGHRSKLG